MAINLDERYPGRAGPKTLDYPQGSFKNRTSPTSKDGTYLEQDWANDMLALFQSLMKEAGFTANGQVDTVQSSQYFDALIKNIQKNSIAYYETAPTVEHGPVIYDLQHDIIKRWRTIHNFTGYASNRIGDVIPSSKKTPRDYEVEAAGAIVYKSDYPALWAFAQENGLVRAVYEAGALWYIDIDANRFRLPDLRNQFIRFTGTDADNANARLLGTHQADALQNIVGTLRARSGLSDSDGGQHQTFVSNPSDLFHASMQEGNHNLPFSVFSNPTIGRKGNSIAQFDASRVARTSTETRAANVALAPRIIAY